MKPHPRIRKTIKWGGVVVTVLLVVVWLASGVGPCKLMRFPYEVSIAGGCFSVLIADRAVNGLPQQLTFVAYRYDHYSLAWWYWGSRWTNAHEYDVPLWIVVVAYAVATGIAWRPDIIPRRTGRRTRENTCPTCGYDRTGISILAACPECGTF